jgi:NitT/TauT family transport system substrate-binding protein
VAGEDIGRRTALKRIGALATALAGASGIATAADRSVVLAFCGQLLCVIPYEVARARGYFAEEGLDVKLVYTHGGNAAMQALVGRASDYAATSFDVALQAFARGAKIIRFASTGQLPLYALATAPKTTAEIRSVNDLQSRTVGISGIGNADHILVIYLIKKAGGDPGKAHFVSIGTNLFEALVHGQVDAGMVQEPALSLIIAEGGKVLVNMMDLADANKYLGGPYEFMGVAVRAEERLQRLDEMRRLAQALEKGLKDTRRLSTAEAVDTLPKVLIAGSARRAQLVAVLERYKRSLYPDSVKIDSAATARVAEAHKSAGLLAPSVNLAGLLDLSVIER